MAASEEPKRFSSLALGSIVIFVVSFVLFLWRKSSRPRRNKGKSKNKQVQVEVNGHDIPKKAITVLFGTQTGTAENFAKILAEEIRARYGKNAVVQLLDLDEYAQDDNEYEEKLVAEKYVMFVTATYGDGEPTDNAARFYKWLLQRADEEEGTGTFSTLAFGVFGLGNRQYEHFNAVGKAVDSSLLKLGAQRLVEVGLGDDDQCIEDDFTQWKEALWPQLDALLQVEGAEPVTEHAYAVKTPEYKVEIHPTGTPNAVPSRPGPIMSRKSSVKNGVKIAIADALPQHRVPVAVKRELHSATSDRSCIHVELDIAGTGIEYETGDHVAVFADNQKEVVEAAAACLGLPLDTSFSLRVPAPEGQDGSSGAGSMLPEPFPGPVTLGVALARYADILSSPRKTALLALAEHAEDADETARLRHLASAAGKDEFHKWIFEAQRSLLEVMQEFPSAKPPLGVFFAAVAARLQPRFYSISSSPRMAPTRIHITCAVVEERLGSGRLHRGVASTFLKHAVPVEADAEAFTSVPIFVRASTFRLPAEKSAPLVMVGPGTGLAPFRGFLQERAVLLQEGEPLGRGLLFFGCRNREKDFIYREELEQFSADKKNAELFVAFSRDTSEKEYVQHHMLAKAPEIWDILSKGGYLYVCGDAKAMAKDVHRTLHSIIIEQGGVASSKAEALVKRLQQESRYQRDVW